MKFVIFCHSLESDWNHGNAHFLRGVVADLLARGHAVDVYERQDGWSRSNLLADAGAGALDSVRRAFGWMRPMHYDLATADIAAMTDAADAVIVHEWNDHGLVHEIGRLRDSQGYRLFFHDTHHRAVTRPDEMAAYDLSEYDGVLAFGRVIRDLYLQRGWARRAWTWHEAADTRVFRPIEGLPLTADLVWIGNWGT
ncbi:MAG: glycosyltransferase, partial [Chloroflexi bacterium]|nr:glycosyltransferase [Chloroflexota bacterium]